MKASELLEKELGLRAKEFVVVALYPNPSSDKYGDWWQVCQDDKEIPEVWALMPIKCPKCGGMWNQYPVDESASFEPCISKC